MFRGEATSAVCWSKRNFQMLVFVKGGKLFKNQTIVINATSNVKKHKQLMLFDQKISK